MSAPIFPIVNPVKNRENGCCVILNKQLVCQMNPFTDEIQIKKPRKCAHCGAIERLTTGECAYCRQP